MSPDQDNVVNFDNARKRLQKQGETGHFPDEDEQKKNRTLLANIRKLLPEIPLCSILGSNPERARRVLLQLLIDNGYSDVKPATVKFEYVYFFGSKILVSYETEGDEKKSVVVDEMTLEIRN